MSNISPENYDHFFQALIGTDYSQSQFEFRLSRGVQASFQQDGEPYRALMIQYIGEVHDALGKMPELSGPDYAALRVNAEVGVRSAVLGLGQLGSLYARKAKVPQTVETVDKSVSTVVHYMFGIACHNGQIGSQNLDALFDGYNPNGRLNHMRGAFMRKVVGDEVRHMRSYMVTTDDEGQITTTLRYPVAKAKTHDSKSRCPASAVRSELSTSKHALYALLKSIGSVVSTEIYPLQFPIV